MSSFWYETKNRPPKMSDFATQEEIDNNKHTKGLSVEVYISYMSHKEYILGLGMDMLLEKPILAEVTMPFNGPLKWSSIFKEGSKDIKEPTFWRKK